jgi:phosphoglycerate dehydrogenase-like enzyme
MAMTPARAADVCAPATRALIDERFEATWAGDRLDAAELRRLLPGHDVVVTSWGTPTLPSDLLGAPRGGPQIVAHAAGTVKNLLDPAVLADGVTAFSAASRIAWSVGEYCLTATLTLLRRLGEYDAVVRAGGWKPDSFRGRELRGRRVGIVGASSTARAFLTLLRPFGPEVSIYDPYLSESRASELGGRPASLEEVMGSEVVSVHVPNLPATEGLITAELIKQLPDGAVLINSARAAAVDLPELLRQVRSGRIRAALDVFSPEPARLDADTLADPNLLLSPHIAGDSLEGHQALVGYVLQDVIGYLDDGRRGASWVDPAVWSIAA